MPRNITLKINEELLKETRSLAAEDDESISSWVSKLIESEIEKRKGFLKAKKRATSVLKKGISLKRKALSRAELYE